MRQGEPRRCDELKLDYMLYAIGAMEEPERSEIRAHLESGCETCTSGLRQALALTFSMGALVDGPEPPPELRGRVFAVCEAPARPTTTRVQPANRSPFWARPIAKWQAFALAAACVAMAIVPAILWRRAVSESKAQLAALAATVRSRDQLAKLEGAPSLRVDPIVPLELERGAPGEAVAQVSIPFGASAVVLALPEDLMRKASAAELRDAAGQTVRLIAPIPALSSETIGLTVDAQLLQTGRYSLLLRDGDRVIGRFPFTVDRR